MDNRLRFLYCCMSELWGHRGKAQARNGKPRASGYQPGRKSRQAMGRRDADRNLVGKCVSQLSRKAAIVHTAPVP